PVRSALSPVPVSTTNRMDQPDSEPLITLREAGRRAGLGLRQLERACAEGELVVYRVGGWRRVRWTDVEAWLARQCAGASGRAPTGYGLRLAASYVDAFDGDGVLAKAAIDIVLGPPVIPAPLTREQDGAAREDTARVRRHDAS